MNTARRRVTFGLRNCWRSVSVRHVRQAPTVHVEAFIGSISGLFAEIEQNRTLSTNYGHLPRSTASSFNDSTKSKQGETRLMARISSPQPAPVVAAHITVSISASSRSIPTSTSPGRGRSLHPWQKWRLSYLTTSNDIGLTVRRAP